jgi:hypothetical protein
MAERLASAGRRVRIEIEEVGISNPADRLVAHQFSTPGGSPMISVNSKKRELIGNFRNAEVKWDRSPVLVNDHDECGRFVDLAMPVKIDPMSLVPPPPKPALAASNNVSSPLVGESIQVSP